MSILTQCVFQAMFMHPEQYRVLPVGHDGVQRQFHSGIPADGFVAVFHAGLFFGGDEGAGGFVFVGLHGGDFFDDWLPVLFLIAYLCAEKFT